MSAWSTSSMKIARRSAAIRPANPRPTGIRTPCSTSSSIPFAARATSSFGALVEQQERRRVRVQELRHPLQELGQQIVERQVRERDVGDALQRLERVRRPRAIHGGDDIG